ncbi:MAG: cysteine synthase A [Nitrospinota bacterium]
MEGSKRTTILDFIGATPLVQLTGNSLKNGGSLYAKVESFTPGGSIKDRMALSIISDARQRGSLHAGGVIVEPTSGNTGISLAMVGASLGHRVILVMPGPVRAEQTEMLRAYGAEVELTDGKLGMLGAIERAKKLVRKNPGFFMPDQFANPTNPEIHRKTTAREILRQMSGKRIDVFVAGVGTGGTITGVGEVLRTRYPSVKIVAVEPAGSPVLSGQKPGPHTISGIGAGFIPAILNRDIISNVCCVSDKEAEAGSQLLARTEGILAGRSSGAAFSCAVKIAKQVGPGKNIVTVFPDTGERHLCNY